MFTFAGVTLLGCSALFLLAVLDYAKERKTAGVMLFGMLAVSCFLVGAVAVTL